MEHPKIFVISLKRREDRRKAVKERFENLGLSYQMIDAVDGQSLSEDELSHLADKEKSSWMTKSEIACAASHRLVYQKIVDENLDGAIVMEDDAIPTVLFLEFLKSKQSFYHYDLLAFYITSAFVYRWIYKIKINNFSFYKSLSNPPGAVAYYISDSLAKKVLKQHPKIDTVADWPKAIQESRKYISYPFLVKHDNDISSDLREKLYIPTNKGKSIYKKLKSFFIYKWKYAPFMHIGI